MKKNNVRIVLDTNTYISALYTKGVCRQALSHIFTHSLRLFTNTFILEEIETVADRQYFRKTISRSTLENFLHVIRAYATITNEITEVSLPISSSDPKDKPIVDCVGASRANVLITGNTKHFTCDDTSVQILTAGEFLKS